MNDGITETEVFAIIGRLYAENQILRQQLILLQQQIAQGQQVQANGEVTGESPKVAKKVKA